MKKIIVYLILSLIIINFFSWLFFAKVNIPKIIANDFKYEQYQQIDTLYLISKLDSKIWYEKSHQEIFKDKDLSQYFNYKYGSYAVKSINSQELKNTNCCSSQIMFYKYLINNLFPFYLNIYYLTGSGYGSIAYEKSYFWFFKWYLINEESHGGS
ncbi:MAG: hypothetical protein ACOCWG_04140 [bacterium]